MTSVSTVLARAEADLAGGRFEDALRGFAALVQAVPRFPRARLRVADALLNLGHKKKAIEVYRALAWHYLRLGQPLLGLVAAKMVIALDPAYQDILEILAELYSADSDRLADTELAPVDVTLEGVELTAYPLSSGVALADEAAKLAANADAGVAYPRKLPPVPLYSHLSKDVFTRVLDSLRLRRFADGETIIAEGTPGDAFYMLADGLVVVTKKVGSAPRTLAHLSEGAVFGEMALVSNAPRTATVTARGEVALLSLARADLESQAGELDSLTQALRKFTRGRFLANLAATSPLFAQLERDERRALLKRFQAQLVGAGDILIEEGEAGRGLFLVLRGEFDVAVGTLKVATLKSGEVFGEISLLRASPTTATVTARTQGEILFLARDDFAPALAAHPGMHSALHELTTKRLVANQAVVAASILTQDSAILV